MRFSRKKNYRSWDKRTSALAHAAKARKRMENPPDYIPRPEPGMLLHRIRVESPVSGPGFEVLVKQARRLNQVVLETFGRSSEPMGIDCLARNLRKRLVTRWAH